MQHKRGGIGESFPLGRDKRGLFNLLLICHSVFVLFCPQQFKHLFVDLSAVDLFSVFASKNFSVDSWSIFS